MPPIPTPSKSCWRAEQADDFSIIVDADHYFAAARQAMLRAKKSIFLVGWDFDATVTLGSGQLTDGGPGPIGEFLTWLAARSPDLQIRLLIWNPGGISAWLKRANFPYLLRWKFNKQITARLDGNHPVGSSHHQKVLVIDDAMAFCGGIDVTLDRWDTRDHIDHDPRRRRPDGTYYGPWHDTSSFCSGPAARALGDLCRRRWRSAGGEQLEPVEVLQPALPIDGGFSFGAATVDIARTSPHHGENEGITEIEQLYVEMIRAAKRTIYAESQYFASRKIAQEMARRLAEVDGPEIVLINPVGADNWLGAVAMDSARARLRESLRRHDRYDRFQIYHPITATGEAVYVHSKLMIVDDRIIRVGSSNFNNRSMRFDNECDVAVNADQDPSGALAAKLIAFRDDLIAEHLGLSADIVSRQILESNSIIAAIETLRAGARETRTLIPYETPKISDLEKWLADNEILDPEGPDAVFESIEKRGLFRGYLKRPLRSKQA